MWQFTWDQFDKISIICNFVTQALSTQLSLDSEQNQLQNQSSNYFIGHVIQPELVSR